MVLLVGTCTFAVHLKISWICLDVHTSANKMDQGYAVEALGNRVNGSLSGFFLWFSDNVSVGQGWRKTCNADIRAEHLLCRNIWETQISNRKELNWLQIALAIPPPAGGCILDPLHKALMNTCTCDIYALLPGALSMYLRSC